MVVGFGAEFAVLWLERYREAVAGAVPAGRQAAAVAGGAAAPGILTSGAALVLGFLAMSVGGLPGLEGLGFDLPMLRDFGLVAALDIALAVGAALFVLPALVAWTESRAA
jgi:predicted RND superfamily exporter protein